MKGYLRLGLLLCLTGCSPPSTPQGATDGAASASSPLALSPDETTLWVVNPDADSVTPVNAETLKAGEPIAVGREPWSVAVTPSGLVVVMNRLDGSLSLLEQGRRTDIEVGPEPGGLALSPSGKLAYVTVSSADEVAVVDLRARQIVERRKVGRYPWAVAVTDDGDNADDDETIVVTHRFARLRPDGQEGKDDGKEAWISVLQAAGSLKELVIDPYVFGFPNVLEGLTVAGESIWVSHLLGGPDLPRTFHQTVSAGLSSLSLSLPGEEPVRQLHLNDPDFSTPVNFPRAVALSEEGSRAYLVLSGSNAVMGLDLSDAQNPRLIGFWGTGDNPRGIVLNSAGTRAYVMNYLSRDVSVLDLTDTVGRPELARVIVSPETLEPEMLRGKVLFNSAVDPRLSRVGWLSCAACHPDGGSDGSTWLTPDGPRQTMPLWNLAGSAPFHASATRDELQDVEGDIETLMGGVGLAPGLVNRLLGAANAQTSDDLDALASFVLNGIRVPRASLADPDAIAAGREVFETSGCAGCHGGPGWTTSKLPGPVGTLALGNEEEVRSVLRRVGSYDPAQDILGERGFDVPTLLGLHASAPYLHDGSAQGLEHVLANLEHTGVALDAQERNALSAFLQSIDADTPPIAPLR